MKNLSIIITVLAIMTTALYAQSMPSADDIIRAVDKNLNAETTILTSKMVVHGRRVSRTIVSKSWIEGTEKSFSEYISPAREKGTKMLKIDDNLWTYSPSTDRIIQISGHMLRQSVMGSDLSYEDMMEDQSLFEDYNAEVVGSEIYQDADCWVLKLSAKESGMSYDSRKLWVDKKKLVPLREELYAKSGKLIKSLQIKETMYVDGRYYPKVYLFKDELKSNSRGTEWIIEEIQFNGKIKKQVFSKSSLRK